MATGFRPQMVNTGSLNYSAAGDLLNSVFENLRKPLESRNQFLQERGKTNVDNATKDAIAQLQNFSGPDITLDQAIAGTLEYQNALKNDNPLVDQDRLGLARNELLERIRGNRDSDLAYQTNLIDIALGQQRHDSQLATDKLAREAKQAELDLFRSNREAGRKLHSIIGEQNEALGKFGRLQPINEAASGGYLQYNPQTQRMDLTPLGKFATAENPELADQLNNAIRQIELTDRQRQLIDPQGAFEIVNQEVLAANPSLETLNAVQQNFLSRNQTDTRTRSQIVADDAAALQSKREHEIKLQETKNAGKTGDGTGKSKSSSGAVTYKDSNAGFTAFLKDVDNTFGGDLDRAARNLLGKAFNAAEWNSLKGSDGKALTRRPTVEEISTAFNTLIGPDSGWYWDTPMDEVDFVDALAQAQNNAITPEQQLQLDLQAFIQSQGQQSPGIAPRMRVNGNVRQVTPQDLIRISRGNG